MSTLLAIGLTNALTATVLAIVVWCVTRVWRQPAVAQLLWVLVLIKLVTPPLIAIPWTFERPAQIIPVPLVTKTEVEQPIKSAADETTLPTLKPKRAQTGSDQISVPVVRQPDATPSASLHWEAIALGMWLVGSTAWLLTAAVRLTRFHRALPNTMDCPAHLIQMADQVAAKLGVASRFQLRMTEGRLSPLVWPIGRPTILLSRPLLAELSAEEIETLLAHELAHLKRKDHWLRWLEFFVTAVYWWHPVLWWTRHQIHKAEEQACDAWVVWAFPDAANRYASALFKVIQMVSDQRTSAPLVASQLGSTGNLKERIEDIMNATWNYDLARSARLLVAFMFVVALPLSLRTTGGETEASPAKQSAPPANGSNEAAPTTDKPRADEHTNSAELAARREHVAFLKNQFVKVDSLYKTGSRGGSADSRALAAYELATAECDLALAEGHVDEAIAHAQKAEQFADNAMKSTTASYESGRVSLQLLLEVARNLADSKLRFSRIRQSASASSTSAPSNVSIRNGASQELTNMESAANTLSLAMLRKMFERRKSEYERSAKLVDQGTISASELEKVKEEYELSADRLQQAQRERQYRKLVLELAQAEYQQAIEANKRAARAVSSSELRRLKILVELAEAKLNDIGN